jgi:hypothetical protein
MERVVERICDRGAASCPDPRWRLARATGKPGPTGRHGGRAMVLMPASNLAAT